MRTIKETITSNKGFYLGDLCYVLNHDTYDKIWGEQYGYGDGLIPVDVMEYVMGLPEDARLYVGAAHI